MIDVLLLILFAVLPAIILHECAHGFAALWLGDDTAKRMGRLTLNPIKHIDPVGSIFVPGGFFLLHYFKLTSSLILFGWAKPVPVNFSRLRNLRLGMVLVAAAGPLTNIILAWSLAQIYLLPMFNGIAHILGWAIMFNLMLAVFNMVPIPPLDGSRIVTALLPKKLAYYYVSLEPFGFIILFVLLNANMLRFLYPAIQYLAFLIGVQI